MNYGRNGLGLSLIPVAVWAVISLLDKLNLGVSGPPELFFLLMALWLLEPVALIMSIVGLIRDKAKGYAIAGAVMSGSICALVFFVFMSIVEHSKRHG